MKTTPESGEVCSTCGSPLDEGGGCMVCLLQAGLDQTAQEEPPPKNAPQFGDFEIARHADGSLWELGRGAMGITYRAVDRVLQRQVALKVIETPTERVRSQTVRERFLREARAAAALRHPNVAGVFQFGVSPEAGRCYYAMELVEGETLEARVRRDGPLDVEAVLEIASQVAATLLAAAQRGLIHRDLKPSNLMLNASDEPTAKLEVKVIDFGLAKATAAAPGETDLTQGWFAGTPAFASPEQCNCNEVDARTDIYSLGVTLWYALTGRVPFAAKTMEALCHQKTHALLPVDQLTARKVPAPVVSFLRHLLAVNPERRPASARELVVALENCRRRVGAASSHPLPAEQDGSKAAPWWVILLVIAVVAALVGAVASRAFLPRRNAHGHAGPGGTIPEKSIAVLPFTNLSADKDNAFFAGGVQDEILTDLAKVADLKVINRTSVMEYGPSHARNLREISQELGVAHVLEGSVQKSAGRVRVIAQLIDTRTGAQLWADRYDGDLSDIFAIQSQMAERIVASLRAKLLPEERLAIDARPTADLAAYDLYLQGKNLVNTFTQTPNWRETLFKAVRLLDEATARDGNFALAFCQVARAHDQLYFLRLDRTPARLALQEYTSAEALRLQPNLGEAHLARVRLLYHGRRDYPAARRELESARAALPNNADVLLLTSFIDRREGRWQEARLNQERALSLDPLNPDTFNDQMVLYDMMRLYREEIRMADLGVNLIPASADYFRLIRAEALLEGGQTAAAKAQLDALPKDFDPNGAATYTRVCVALYDRRLPEAEAALAAFREDEYPGINGVMTPHAWLEALVARAAGDENRARKALTAAREVTQTKVQAHPDDPAPLALLGQIDAALGRKEEALSEGRRAVEMRPVSADATDGPALLWALALVCAWTDEPETAMGHLTTLEKTPGGPDYGQLKHDPAWSVLRDREDYGAMLARLDPQLGP